MFKLLIFVYLGGQLADVSDEGLFSGHDCHNLGRQMVFINRQIDTSGISLKYRCVMGS